MAVQRDYNKPLTEEEPYLVQNIASADFSRLQTVTDWYGNPITDPDRSNPTRNRYESPLQTIMSFEYAISRGENELIASRPSRSTTDPRYSYQPQPSRRTSSNSAYAMQSQQPYQQRQDYRERDHPNPPRERERHTPPRDYPPRGEREYNTPPRDNAAFRSSGGVESIGEFSGASSYDPHHVPPQQVSYPQVSYPQQGTQEYSPPSTPPRQVHFPQGQYQSYGIPTPEPEVDPPAVYPPRVPPKPAMNTFVARPATPPGSDFDQKPKVRESKMGKFKRFSGFGRIKS